MSDQLASIICFHFKTAGIFGLGQGSPILFFLRAKNSSPVGPKSQETPSGTSFKTNSQFLFSLTIINQKLQISLVYVQI
jgi:hypothetical protein